MYRSAFQLYQSLFCWVGGGGKLHANGCCLTDQFVLTALHNHAMALRKYGGTEVMTYRGVFRAELAASAPEHDVAVLALGEQIKSSDRPAPERFPRIDEKPLEHGASVGYITRLARNFTGDRLETAWLLQTGHVAMRFPDNPRHWGLTTSFTEGGFSGAPAFSPEGDLLGVLVRVVQIGSAELPVAKTHEFTVIAQLHDLAGQLAEFMTR